MMSPLPGLCGEIMMSVAALKDHPSCDGVVELLCQQVVDLAGNVYVLAQLEADVGDTTT